MYKIRLKIKRISRRRLERILEISNRIKIRILKRVSELFQKIILRLNPETLCNKLSRKELNEL